MTTEQIRKELSKLYGPSWVKRVREMSDRQVHAGWQRHISKKEKN